MIAVVRLMPSRRATLLTDSPVASAARAVALVSGLWDVPRDIAHSFPGIVLPAEGNERGNIPRNRGP